MPLELNDIHLLDCVKGLAELKPESIDLAFADPPFNIGYKYDVYDDRKEADRYLDWCRQWMSGVAKALKPTGTFWLAIGDEYAAELKLIATRELGLTCRNWVIWYYTFGVHCNKKFSRSHAHLFYFVKNPKQYTFNDSAIRVPSARQLVYADNRANPNGRVPDDTWILRPQDFPEGFGAGEDTWYFPRVCGTFKERLGGHGCQMPEQLLGRITRACSTEGDVVLDPFAGTGTTLAVAKKLGRKFIGFEISQSYRKRILERLDQIRIGNDLDGAADPLKSAPATPNGHTLGRPRSKPKASNNPTSDLSRIERPNTESPGGVAKAIREAYILAASGFSTDRVLADPELNFKYVELCNRWGIPGKAIDWNHRLIGLRKAGYLKGLPKPTKFIIPRERMDGYLFASEIAWQLLADRDKVSLDEILCDPKRAGEFDSMAARFAPGWSPLEYRWGALRIRKEAKEKRGYAQSLQSQEKRRRFSSPVGLDRPDKLPATEGVYLIETQGRFYLGESLNLKARIEKHAEHLCESLPEFGLKTVSKTNVLIKYIPVSDSTAINAEHVRLGLRSLLMGGKCPIANSPLLVLNS